MQVLTPIWARRLVTAEPIGLAVRNRRVHHQRSDSTQRDLAAPYRPAVRGQQYKANPEAR